VPDQGGLPGKAGDAFFGKPVEPVGGAAHAPHVTADLVDAAPIEVMVSKHEVGRTPKARLELAQVLLETRSNRDISTEENGVWFLVEDLLAESLDLLGLQKVEMDIRAPDETVQ